MIRSEVQERVAIITIDNPPVNALPVAGWFQLAETLRAMGRDPDVAS
jgi:enoyl-CoA hydratase